MHTESIAGIWRVWDREYIIYYYLGAAHQIPFVNFADSSQLILARSSKMLMDLYESAVQRNSMITRIIISQT